MDNPKKEDNLIIDNTELLKSKEELEQLSCQQKPIVEVNEGPPMLPPRPKIINE